MNQQEYQQQMLEEMEDLQEEQALDQFDDQMQNQREWQEAYGSPEPEQQHNQHTFLANSLDFQEPEKVTWLGESELGRPLFNVRFLLDIEDIAHYYLDEEAKKLGVKNEIAAYFREKIKNICDSGMSNKGFVQNLNVTRRMDSTRQRIKNLEPKQKGDIK